MKKKHKTRRLKYKIKELLMLHKIPQYAMAVYLEVSFKTLHSWCNIEIGDHYSIPGDYLLRMAFFFDTTVEALYCEQCFEEDGC